MFDRMKQTGAAVLLMTVMGASACSGTTNDPAPPGSTPGTALGAEAPITAVPGLDPSALDVMNQAAYANGQWAISVRDLDSGETLVAFNNDKFFEPGSVVKTYAIGAGWLEFGPDSTITTPVKRQGEVVGGTLNGDLVLVGKGDLTMGGRTKPDGTVDYTNLDHNDANPLPGATLTPEDPLTGLDQLAVQVKDSGITNVTGNVVVDDRLWDPDALENGPVTPIIINNNLIDLTTTPGAVGQTATIEMRPEVAPWTVTSEVTTVAAGGETKIEVTAPTEGTIVLKGTIAADSPPALKVYAFKDPATFARTAFIEALQRAGVTVTADPLATNTDANLPSVADVDALPSVAELESLPLDQEATYVLKVSYNLGAQTMVCRLAVAAGSTDCDDGLARAAELWTKEGLDTKGAALIDGSGLPGNVITTDSQVQLQTIMAKRPDADRWRATLPIMGVDGSLSMVQADSPAKGKVFAKTGSLGQADLFNGRIRLPSKALGGYIDAASGRRLAFSIIATNSVFTDVSGVFAANDDVGKVAGIIQQTY